jgi:hypothetical protein
VESEKNESFNEAQRHRNTAFRRSKYKLGFEHGRFGMRRLLLIIALIVIPAAQAAELTGDALFEAVLNGVGARGCADGGIFRTCLNLKPQQCNAIVRSAAHMCFQRMGEDIPKVIATKSDAEKWGARISTCIASITANANSDMLNMGEPVCAALTVRDAGK